MPEAIFHLFIILACSVSFTGAEKSIKGLPPKQIDLVTGSICRNFLYGVHTPHPADNFIGYGGTPGPLDLELWKAKLESPAEVTKLSVCDNRTKTLPYRWRLDHGCFWGTGTGVSVPFLSRVPMAKLRAFDPKIIRGMENLSFSWFLEPLYHLAIDNSKPGALSGRDFTAVADAFFDFLPVEPGTAYVFVAWKGKMRVWEGKLSFSRDRTRPGSDQFIWSNPVPGVEPNSPSYKPILENKTEIKQPFVVYGDKSRFFFVTVSGELHVWEEPGKKGQNIRRLWDDVDRPIRGVVHDADRNRNWAFTGSDKDRPAMYFELAAKINERTYVLEKLEGRQIPESFARVLQYTQVLQRRKGDAPLFP